MCVRLCSSCDRSLFAGEARWAIVDPERPRPAEWLCDEPLNCRWAAGSDATQDHVDADEDLLKLALADEPDALFELIAVDGEEQRDVGHRVLR